MSSATKGLRMAFTQTTGRLRQGWVRGAGTVKDRSDPFPAEHTGFDRGLRIGGCLTVPHACAVWLPFFRCI
jgi:hypothetical protein